MTLAVLLVVIAVLSLVFVVRFAVLRTLQTSRDAALATQIEPLDVKAFRVLTDPGEDAYLRRHLPASEFRKVRRVRLQAMAAYVRVAGRNAAALALVGQRVLASGDAASAEAALQLVNQALLLRRNAAVVLVRIYLDLAWPHSLLAVNGLLDGYRELGSAAMLLGRLQNPAAPVRISIQ